jgi:hypothetical protein
MFWRLRLVGYLFPFGFRGTVALVFRSVTRIAGVLLGKLEFLGAIGALSPVLLSPSRAVPQF